MHQVYGFRLEMPLPVRLSEMNQEMCFSQYFTIPKAGTGPDRIPKIAIEVQIECEQWNASNHIRKI